MRSRIAGRVALVVALGLGVSATAAADAAGGAGGAAGSGMGQGQAAIKVRSDVSMAIRGTRATPRERLQALGEVVMGRMGAVRTCYRTLVKKRPTSVGAFAITIELEPKAPTRLEVEAQGGSDRQLRRCVVKALSRLPLAGVARPASAVVTLRFANSRAEGQAALEVAKAGQEAVAIREGASGVREASWRTADGRITFRASAASGKRTDAAVSAVIRGVRAGFAPFLDCRRRAAKRGRSPVGELHARVRLRADGRGEATLGEVTVAHPRAPNCARAALRKLRYPAAPPGVRVDLVVIFAQ